MTTTSDAITRVNLSFTQYSTQHRSLWLAFQAIFVICFISQYNINFLFKLQLATQHNTTQHNKMFNYIAFNRLSVSTYGLTFLYFLHSNCKQFIVFVSRFSQSLGLFLFFRWQLFNANNVMFVCLFVCLVQSY